MIDFSLYPNLNGQLGQNKVAIPDGVTTFWPDGDALVGNFIYKNGKLSGFVDTKALISNDAKSTTIPYDYFEAEMENVRESSMSFNLGDRCKNFTLKLMPKYKGCKTINDIKAIDENYMENDIVDGAWTKDLEDLEHGTNSKIDGGMFYNCENITSFNAKLSSLYYAIYMFYKCTNLSTFNSNLISLKDGGFMFGDCFNLSSFTSDLRCLILGNGMFQNCSNLPSFNSDLSSLKDGGHMFNGCSTMVRFTSKIKSLTSGAYMFHGCSSLTSFESDLSSLTNGNYMFFGCSNLTSITSDLSSLTNGNSMFGGCSNLKSFEAELKSLDTASYMFINCGQLSSFTSDLTFLTNGTSMFQGCSGITTFKSNLKSLTNGSYMFYGCKLDTLSLKNIAESINTVTNAPVVHIGIGNKTPTEEENTYLTQIHNKGWQVYVNGSSDSNIFNPTSLIPIDGEQNLNPIPFWAKPVPSKQEEANYIDENGNYYNILGGQFIYVNDPESYGMFMNEEDAAMQMRLTRIEKEDI